MVAVSQMWRSLRGWIVMENKLGSMDPEIYPTVVVSLGTAAWGALVLFRKAKNDL